MAVQNGRLPASMLAEIPWAPGEYVAATALPSLVRLNAAFRARFGRDLTINEGYRPYATQVDYKARTKLAKSDPRYLKSAATPGTSVHGWGEAVDFGHIYGFGSAEYAWLAANAPAIGWWQPPQYRKDGRYPEYWHWERNPALEQIPTEEDDMALSDEALKQIGAVVHDKALEVLRAEAGPRVLGTRVSPETGTLAQTVRDARQISRRAELAIAALAAQLAGGGVDPDALAAQVRAAAQAGAAEALAPLLDAVADEIRTALADVDVDEGAIATRVVTEIARALAAG